MNDFFRVIYEIEVKLCENVNGNLNKMSTSVEFARGHHQILFFHNRYVNDQKKKINRNKLCVLLNINKNLPILKYHLFDRS